MVQSHSPTKRDYDLVDLKSSKSIYGGMNLVLALRELARVTPDQQARQVLKNSADAITNAIKALATDYTQDNVRALNSVWARGQRMFDLAKAPPTPTPPIVERLAA